MSATYTTREEHPWPAIVLHYLHLISMAVLIYTGFYIHRPFGPGSMDAMRTLHFTFMFIVIYVAIIRVYWAFLGRGSANSGKRAKVPDYKHFGPEAENKGQAWQTVRYYLFMRKTHPHTAKYNTLQKGTYVLWLLLIAFQALSGFALWTPTAAWFAPMTYWLGGPIVVREIHYLTMWLFIITVMVHVYLSIAEAWRQLPLMFAGYESGNPPEPTSKTAGA